VFLASKTKIKFALAAKRAAPTTELVWLGPSTQVSRRTNQILCDLIRRAERRLTSASFDIFQVPLLVEGLEHASTSFWMPPSGAQ